MLLGYSCESYLGTVQVPQLRFSLKLLKRVATALTLMKLHMNSYATMIFASQELGNEALVE